VLLTGVDVVDVVDVVDEGVEAAVVVDVAASEERGTTTRIASLLRRLPLQIRMEFLSWREETLSPPPLTELNERRRILALTGSLRKPISKLLHKTQHNCLQFLIFFFFFFRRTLFIVYYSL
jgi:hypothetical protein